MYGYSNMRVVKATAQHDKTSESYRHFLTGLRLFFAVAAVFVLLRGANAGQPQDAGNAVGQAGQSHGHLVFREYVPQP